jgi:hypothetical protein
MLLSSYKIRTGKCDLCGATSSLVKCKSSKQCRSCVPDLWEKVAESEKEKWLRKL